LSARPRVSFRPFSSAVPRLLPTQERFRGAARLASAAALVALGSGQPPDPIPGARRSGTGIGARSRAARHPASGRFRLQARSRHRAQAAGQRALGGQPHPARAAHRIASDIVMFLRGELVEKPFRKAQGKTVLDPLAYPPTLFSMEMLAFLPVLQRERAGFVERLGHYLSTPAPRRAFWVLAGRKLLKPLFVILGDPLRSDAQGRVTDVAFAVYWLELLARLGVVRQVPSASRVLES